MLCTDANILKNVSHNSTYKKGCLADIIEGDLTNNITSYPRVALLMQEGIDRCEGGFKATGGAIRPDKSFIFPIHFKWNDNGDYTFSSLQDLQPTFTVKDENNICKPLPLKESHEGAETLGVLCAQMETTKPK